MKYLVVLALAALVAARPDGETRPRPKPKGPAIFVRPVHRAAQDEDYEFKFGIAGMKELDESEVSLWKVVRGDDGPELEKADFDVQLKTLNQEEIEDMIEEKKEKMKEVFERLKEKEEIIAWLKEKKGDIKEWIEEKKEAIRERIGDEKYEKLKEWVAEKKEAIKEWIEEKKEQREGDDKDGKERRPKPQFKYAIVGKATVSDVSCDDQGPYLVRYGAKREDKEEEKEEREVEGRDGDSKRRPRKPRGFFLIFVKGCKRPEPKEEKEEREVEGRDGDSKR